jgi:hypothetical protein
MKKILCAIALLAVVSVASCVEINTIRGNGVTAEKTIALSQDYSELSVSRGIKVVLSPELIDRAELVADEAAMEYLVVTESDGVVKVTYRQDVTISSKIKTVVTLPLSSRVSAVRVSSAASLRADMIETSVPITVNCSSAGNIATNFAAPSIDVNVSSAAKYEGNVAAEEVSVDLSSASKCTLSGECAELDVEASSSAKFDGAELRAAKVSVNASSASSVTVWATAELGVDVSSAASVHYKGTPHLTSTDISSGAKLNKLD